MLQREALDPWIRRVSLVTLITFILGLALGVKPAHAWLFKDPTPRVVEQLLPNVDSTRASNTVYIVKQGDTLLTIAKKFQVNMEQLISLNKISNPNLISVGLMLTIPAIGAGERQSVIYQIKRGDTLSGIAKAYDVEMDTLIAYNKLKNPDRLTIGEEIVIPAQATVPASGGSVASQVSGITVSFGWPVQGIITSNFGRRWGEFHYGLDIAADTGDIVRAAASGKIVAAGWRGTYGQAVIIEHNGIFSTLYAHNSSLLVSEGDWVEQGDPIAKIGSTGRSTGPHLHFEVHQNGKAIDPLRLLK
ncbi:MAG: M23 family metallopeptidase [Bacillota bacterium]|nr:M23 family metallopeptidase [Bacillota bacterium]